MNDEEFDRHWAKIRENMRPEDYNGSMLWHKLGEHISEPGPCWSIGQRPPKGLRRLVMWFWKGRTIKHANRDKKAEL